MWVLYRWLEIKKERDREGGKEGDQEEWRARMKEGREGAKEGRREGYISY